MDACCKGKRNIIRGRNSPKRRYGHHSPSDNGILRGWWGNPWGLESPFGTIANRFYNDMPTPGGIMRRVGNCKSYLPWKFRDHGCATIRNRSIQSFP